MKPEPFRGWWRQEIALYRGDELIDVGTIKEIAERRGVCKDTIYWYTTPAGHRRAKDQSQAVRVCAYDQAR